MKLTIKRYRVMLALQTVLFLVDFFINIFSVLVRQNNGLSLILLIIQCACLVISLGTLFVSFFSTYAFQAGLIDLLYEKFHVSLLIFLLYFFMTIFLQIWFLVVQWNNTAKFMWTTPLFILFIGQRTLTPIYYYFYKRTSLRISDPRFYEDVWNQNRIENSQ
ncbi:transmembrane protein 138 [Tribolium madens]|uniref:transmembrane protein 138 n=1 Tax=Tribolium madens TaxID=41895 RepID=UPI001CF7470F|nr:transmembrane protein 138 [Tribolium madens]